jgi:hypothetical protein
MRVFQTDSAKREKIVLVQKVIFFCSGRGDESVNGAAFTRTAEDDVEERVEKRTLLINLHYSTVGTPVGMNSIHNRLVWISSGFPCDVHLQSILKPLQP